MATVNGVTKSLEDISLSATSPKKHEVPPFKIQEHPVDEVKKLRVSQNFQFRTSFHSQDDLY